jgi:hypothetical protein
MLARSARPHRAPHDADAVTVREAGVPAEVVVVHRNEPIVVRGLDP